MGDPTEGILIVAAAKGGLNVEALQKQLPRLKEIPFDSRRWMMSVVLDWQQSELWPDASPCLVFTKGAPVEVVHHCPFILRNGKVKPLTSGDGNQVVAANDDLARQGYRVLGLAARQGDRTLIDLKAPDLEQQLIFISLVAMFDPPRPEVPTAIDQCHFCLSLGENVYSQAWAIFKSAHLAGHRG